MNTSPKGEGLPDTREAEERLRDLVAARIKRLEGVASTYDLPERAVKLEWLLEHSEIIVLVSDAEAVLSALSQARKEREEALGFAEGWHGAVETACVLMGLSCGNGANEFLKAVRDHEDERDTALKDAIQALDSIDAPTHDGESKETPNAPLSIAGRIDANEREWREATDAVEAAFAKQKAQLEEARGALELIRREYLFELAPADRDLVLAVLESRA